VQLFRLTLNLRGLFPVPLFGSYKGKMGVSTPQPTRQIAISYQAA
jgi:hypothetical protein